MYIALETGRLHTALVSIFFRFASGEFFLYYAWLARVQGQPYFKAQSFTDPALKLYSAAVCLYYPSDKSQTQAAAAVFSDPFLSPGIDQPGFVNTMIVEMLGRDHRKCLVSRIIRAFR